MDVKTIAIGVVIGLFLGGGIGYIIPQSKINELTVNIGVLETQKTSLEHDAQDYEDAIDELHEEQETLTNQITSLDNKVNEAESELEDYQEYYQEMWEEYNDLIQDYNDLEAVTPVGDMITTPVSGVLNGDFEVNEDWLKQGTGGIGWGAAYLHRMESFSTFFAQTITLDSTDLGLQFDVKPEPLGGTVDLQVTMGGYLIYHESYTGPNSSFDYQTVTIPLKSLLEMKETYGLPVEGSYSLQFVVPAGQADGAIIVIDNVSLVEISYQPTFPST